MAAEIGAALRRQLEIVGVFVNPTLAQLAVAAEDESLTMVQLHGDEGPAFCSEVARRTGAKMIKAAPVAGQADIRALAAFHTDFHLLDAHRPGMRGGTGETFDWELVATRRSSVPLVLSGGLRAENVGPAIAATRPFAVDTASGTEARPGVKDPGKVAAFVRAVNATAVEAETAESAR
jgi:phosphoribosylanthranilate isomerase